MIAHVAGTVLATQSRPGQDGRQFVDLYLLQPGEPPVTLYFEVKPGGFVPADFPQGEIVTVEATIWAGRNGLSIRVDRKVDALAGLVSA